MRKNYIGAVIIFIIGISFFLFSCNKTISTPSNLSINEEEVLTWSKVDGASFYEVLVNDKSLYSNDNKIDLFYEIVEPIEYVIKVRALSNNIGNDSNYSTPISYRVPVLSNFSVGLDSKNEYIITGIKSKDLKGKFYIPKEYNGNRITKIDMNCFEGCNELTGLICDKIEEIGSYAFRNCQRLRMVNALNAKSIGTSFENCSCLEKVILGDYLERLNARAFYRTGVREIYLSTNVTRLLPSVFEGCNKLEKVDISAENPAYYVENNCIMSYKDNKLVRGFINSIIPTYTKVLGESAFSGININDIDIPSGVERIENDCFKDCQFLRNIKLPSSITSVKTGIFQNCKNIESISIENNAKYQTINNCLIEIEKGCVILGCKNSTIPTDNFINSISNGAFINTGLKSITIPGNIKTIGANSFKQCDDLEELVLEEGIEKIEKGAFSRCYKLKSVTVPKSVKECYGFENNKCQIIAFKDTKFFTTNDFNYAYYYLEGDTINNSGNSFILPITNSTIVNENGECYVSSISTNNSFNKPYVVPYRKGYRFLGWSTSVNKENIISTIESIQIIDYALTDEGRKLENELVEVALFDLSMDYSNCEMFYSIWEKEDV